LYILIFTFLESRPVPNSWFRKILLL
jgi:hypothetical protein